jgi:hypothetical protein
MISMRLHPDGILGSHTDEGALASRAPFGAGLSFDRNRSGPRRLQNEEKHREITSESGRLCSELDRFWRMSMLFSRYHAAWWCAVTLLWGLPQAHAQQSKSINGEWQPLSTTAMSITGVITFLIDGTDATFVMANDNQLDLQKVGPVSCTDAGGQSHQCDLYKSKTGENPQGLQGTYLCSKNIPPEALAFSTDEGDQLTVVVFTHGGGPCASYGYFR